MDQSPKNQDHNLVNQVKVKRISSRGIYTFLFRVAPVIGAFLFSLSYRWFLDESLPLFPIFILLAFYLVSSGLLTLITKNSSTRYRLLLVEIAALIVPFFGLPATHLIAVLVLLLIFFARGISRARYELYGSTEISFFRIIQPHFGKMLTGITFLVIIFYMPKWSMQENFISENGFQKFFGSTTQITQSFFPDISFSPTSTIRSMAEDIVRAKLPKDIGEDEKEAVIEAAVGNFIKTLEKNFGTEIREQDPATRVFYDVIIERSKSWKDRFGITFAVVWGIVMFFLVRGTGTVVSLISSGILFMIYHLLLAGNILRIGSETKTVETLELV